MFQTKKFQAKRAETNFASGSSIAANLSSFSAARSGTAEKTAAKPVEAVVPPQPAAYDNTAHRAKLMEEAERMRAAQREAARIKAERQEKVSEKFNLTAETTTSKCGGGAEERGRE